MRTWSFGFEERQRRPHRLIKEDSSSSPHSLKNPVRNKKCIIGNGVVLDPGVLIQEIGEIKKRGYLKDDTQLMISEEAHLILPYHKKIDMAREKIFKIGTTGGDRPRVRR
jgi:adenylosuccinate synthase